MIYEPTIDPAKRSGGRMTLADARGVLGRPVAFTAHGGQWVTGQLIGIADTPQLIVRHPDGTTEHYTMSTVDGWTAATGETPA